MTIRVTIEGPEGCDTSPLFQYLKHALSTPPVSFVVATKPQELVPKDPVSFFPQLAKDHLLELESKINPELETPKYDEVILEDFDQARAILDERKVAYSSVQGIKRIAPVKEPAMAWIEIMYTPVVSTYPVGYCFSAKNWK
jgi:hypothetical protein